MKAKFITLFAVLVFQAFPRCGLAQYNAVQRVSQSSAGVQANEASFSPHISADGRYVVFASLASNLVGFDTNNASDIFIHDRQALTTSRISVSSSGTQGNAASSAAVLSSNGRYVAFVSEASNLVSVDTNNASDIFVYDRDIGAATVVTRVSVGAANLQADGLSLNPSISADGRYIVFESDATNLVVGDTNNKRDIFLYDFQTAATTRVSVTAEGLEANNNSYNGIISSDGSIIAFESDASNIVPDGNLKRDIFTYTLASGVVSRVSVDSSGAEANGDSLGATLSATGRYVAFESTASNLVADDLVGINDVFLRDRENATTKRVSINSNATESDGASLDTFEASDGSRTLFTSSGSNLISGDTNAKSDIFAYNSTSGSITRVSVLPTGLQTANNSNSGTISSSSQYMAFASEEENLISTDTNKATDIFVINLECLLALSVASPTDTDGDGTPDCSDGCAQDASKSAAGVCGCFTSDEDSDGDKTPDCIDFCPADSAKTAAGTCGCGVSDSDGNANGVADCLDLNANTVPSPARIKVFGRDIRVSIPADFVGTTKTIELRVKGRRAAQKITSKNIVYFKNRAPGSYNIRYSLSLGGTTTAFSPSKRATVN